MCIFLFWLADVIFSTLTKNKKIKIKEKLEIIKILAAPLSFLVQKLFITFFL